MVGMEQPTRSSPFWGLTELCPSDTSVAQNSIKHSQSFNAGATVAGTGFQQMEHHELSAVPSSMRWPRALALHPQTRFFSYTSNPFHLSLSSAQTRWLFLGNSYQLSVLHFFYFSIMGFISNETFYLGLKVGRCSQTLLLVRDTFNVRLVLLSFKCTSISKLEGVVQNKFRSHLQVFMEANFISQVFKLT